MVERLPNAEDAVRDRRSEILDAAGAVLLRFGFRLASVDEVARQAGISRQGLYAYFPNKDALFAAAIDHLLELSVTSARAALAAPGSALEDRLLAAFAAITGDTLVSRLDEILDATERLTGRPAAALEGEIISEFVAALDATPASSPWRRNGDDAQSVAVLLYATSIGLKRLVPTVPDYLDAMRRAIRLICNPKPRPRPTGRERRT